MTRLNTGRAERFHSALALVTVCIVVTLSSAGCIGVTFGVTHGGEFDLQNPLEMEVGENHSFEVRVEDLRQHFGPPEFVVDLPDGQSAWTYSRGLRWRGVWALLLLVPVPFIVPTGTNHVTLVVDRGRVTGARGEVNIHRHTGCGPVWLIGIASDLQCWFARVEPQAAILEAGSARLLPSSWPALSK